MCNEAELATDLQLPSISAYHCNLALDRSIEILQSCNLKKKPFIENKFSRIIMYEREK